jgi:hypothetical protein
VKEPAAVVARVGCATNVGPVRVSSDRDRL